MSATAAITDIFLLNVWKIEENIFLKYSFKQRNIVTNSLSLQFLKTRKYTALKPEE